MDATKSHDWGLIVAGVLLIICSFVFFFWPGLTLVSLAAIAGAAFLVAGIFDIIAYIRMRKAEGLSAWAVVYAICDIILGFLLLVHPLLFAAVIPWVVGVFFVAFGIMEIVLAVRARGGSVNGWGWLIFSGIISILCGLMFFVSPESFSIFLSVFVLMRGISMIYYGWNASKGLYVA